MSEEGLRIVSSKDVTAMHFDPVDPLAREQAQVLLQEVFRNKVDGLVACAVRLKDIESADSKLFYSREDLKKAYDDIDEHSRNVLVRTADRIRRFAQSQRDSIQEMTTDIPGGKAGHFIAPVKVAGCYAPGGRYPLPSSVLMTALTARTAGVQTVWVASPRPAPATLAAAYVAEVDGLLAAGGAHAIGAFAYGAGPIPSCDVIVGPGNKWVTAAKSLVSGVCAIDMLAGPSEVLIIADHTGIPDVIAADLLAQAEHDVEAKPILVCTDIKIANDVNSSIKARLALLSTAPVAREALTKGFACVCDDLSSAVEVSNLLGPEHLEIHTEDAAEVAKRCTNYGAVFIGSVSAEVLGDYGFGPNHVLPTCGTSRYTGGLSVFTFLRIRTWMNVTDQLEAQAAIKDCVDLARIEGLEGHASAAQCRVIGSEDDSHTAKKTKLQ